MNYLDIAIVVAVALSALIGLFRGFIRELLSLISWILAFWVALTYAQPASDFFKPYLNAQELRIVAAFASLFVVTLLLASVLSYLLHKLIAAGGVEGTDRTLGGVFGLVRGAALVAIFVVVAEIPGLQKQTWWKESALVGQFQPVVGVVKKLLPSSVAGKLGTG